MPQLHLKQTACFNCPNCGRRLNWAAQGRSRRENDLYSICIFCQATFIPDSAGGFRGLTIPEWIALKRDKRETYDAIQAAVAHFQANPIRLNTESAESFTRAVNEIQRVLEG